MRFDGGSQVDVSDEVGAQDGEGVVEADSLMDRSQRTGAD